MATADALSNLVALIKDEELRKQAISLMEKAPEFKQELIDRGLRQSDYDRNMNEWKKKVEEADTKIATWQEWYNRNNPIFETTVQENERLKNENTELNDKIKTATTQVAPPVNGQAIDQAQLTSLVEDRLKGRGYVSQTEVTQIAKQEAEKLAQSAQDRFFKETLPASIEFQSTILDLQFQHRDEFGKPLDRGAFGKFMKDNQMTDPVKAYEQFVSAARTEKKITSEVDQRVKDELSKRNVPGTMAQPSPQELGPLQQKIGKKELPEVVYDESIRPGDSRLAAAAASELRSEGKF